MFHVINLETGKPIETPAAIVAIYQTGAEAAVAAKAHSDATGIKHQPRRIVTDVDWRAREQKRFDDGTYLPVPWAGFWWEKKESTKDHFVHASTDKSGMLAFTENEAKGAQDRQTRMRPGRYLKQFYGDELGESNIRALAGEFANRYESTTVKFAATEDDIERVYLNGPSSCMSHPTRQYDCSVHPTRAYAAGDLQVAYLEHADDGITARCVCWPERKVYTRIYGDDTRLGHALRELGYNSGNLKGAKLLRLEEDNGMFAVPYVDSIGYCEDNGTHLILGRGRIDCQQTCGLAGDDQRPTCERCDERYDSDEEGGYVEDISQSWCQHCYDNHTFYCAGTELTFSSDDTDSYQMENGDTWSADYFRRHGATCEVTDRHYPIDDVITLNDGTVWCLDYFDKHGFQCRECGEAYALSDTPDCCADKPLAIAGRDESPDQIELPTTTVGETV